MLRGQTLETPQLGFHELNDSQILLNLTWLCTKASQNFLRNLLRNPCWTWPGSAPKPPRTFRSETCWTLTWLCTKASHTFSDTFAGTLLHLTWLCTKASQTFSGTFSGTLLNLTWFCTKASRNLLRNLLWTPVEPDLALHKSLPDLLQNLLRNILRNPVESWRGSAPKPPKPSSGTFGTFSGTSLNLTRRLHQCTPELF